MQIETLAPFRISKDADGSQHAVKDNIQITTLPDLGEVKINHRRGVKPATQESSRWLHINLVDKGLHIYIHGTHVVVSERDYLPTFDLLDSNTLMNRALKYLQIEKNERGAYIIDTPSNRELLKSLFDTIQDQEKNNLIANIRHAIAKVLE